ncbi:MAG: UDP-N-acetylmuramoyl-L-alanyl-D-glutamate--2,6-diaminopimelate ligase [Pedosphaera sp.]|nr:UDP-N-acetylmuramoyl-L-alanyl-D-glutamate--2,6-diaminopimelate ligase [Pedosphaera sp.]
MQLKDLINKISPTTVEGPVDREITGIAYDSRRVTPGMVFVAIPGENVDGHDFIHAAIDRGATAVICQQNGFLAQRVTKIKVKDSREALANAAAAYYGNPGARLKVIGVTGTNGKTTVAYMVKQILESAGIKTGLIGTVRYEVGERVIPAHRTTPEALEVQQMLAQMLRAGCTACVMEVSSHALDQKRVHGIEFDAAIFTNLTQDHLDYHGTMENYFQAKKSLFDSLFGSSKKAGAVINIDDSFGAELSRNSKAEIQLTYGLDASAKIRAIEINLARDATDMIVEAGGERFKCRLPLIGRHNVYNALAATGAGMVLKVGLPAIRRALQNLSPVPGRLEAVVTDRPFSVYVDYAHTDDALAHVLRTVREITSGRVLLTFGCGGSRDTGKRAKMGRVAAELADFTIITSDNPRKESPATIAAQIEEGFQCVERAPYRIELDRRRAIDEILHMAQPGDCVLIAGKGHETYQEFENTVVPFDDRVHAQEALEMLDVTVT